MHSAPKRKRRTVEQSLWSPVTVAIDLVLRREPLRISLVLRTRARDCVGISRHSRQQEECKWLTSLKLGVPISLYPGMARMYACGFSRILQSQCARLPQISAREPVSHLLTRMGASFLSRFIRETRIQDSSTCKGTAVYLNRQKLSR
jgi:hypothetical protein